MTTLLESMGAPLTKADIEKMRDLLLEAVYSPPHAMLMCSGCGRPMIDTGVVLPADCPHCGITITERRLVE